MSRSAPFILSIVCLLGVAMSTAQAQLGKGLFDSLYGQELRTVKTTVTTDDDLEFAAKLIHEAKTTVPQRGLLIDLCTTAYDLSAPHEAGHSIGSQPLR